MPKIDRQIIGCEGDMRECPETNKFDLDLYEVLCQHLTQVDANG